MMDIELGHSSLSGRNSFELHNWHNEIVYDQIVLVENDNGGEADYFAYDLDNWERCGKTVLRHTIKLGVFCPREFAVLITFQFI